MRYETVDEMWEGAIEDLTRSGNALDSRAGKCIEIVGWTGVLEDPEYNVVLNPIRKFDVAYASAEFLWYMSGWSNVTPLTRYAPSYAHFAEKDGHAYGAYGPRMKSIHEVIELLRKHPETRQAVMLIWRPEDIRMAHRVNDMPCTIALQFLLRDGAVHCVTTMRSNDVWLGLPYDVFCFTMLQRLVADVLNVEIGTYVHNVGSLHYYEKHAEKISQVREPNVFPTPNHNWLKLLIGEIQMGCFMESQLQAGGDLPGGIGVGSPVTDMLIACYKKLNIDNPEKIGGLMFHSEAFQMAWDQKYGAKETA